MLNNTGNQFYSFLKSLTVFTFFLGLLVAAVYNMFSEIIIPSKTIAIFAILYVITSVGYYLLILSSRRSPQNRISLTLLSIVLKLFIYAVFAFLLIRADMSNATANVALFFILYLLYTVFEIVAGSRMLRQKE